MIGQNPAGIRDLGFGNGAPASLHGGEAIFFVRRRTGSIDFDAAEAKAE